MELNLQTLISLTLLIGALCSALAAQEPTLEGLYADWGYDSYRARFAKPFSEENWPALERAILGDDSRLKFFALGMTTALLRKPRVPPQFVREHLAPLSERLSASATLSDQSSKPEAEMFYQIGRLRMLVRFRAASTGGARMRVVQRELAFSQRTRDSTARAWIASEVLLELDHKEAYRVLRDALKMARGWDSLEERLRVGLDKLRLAGELDAAEDSVERNRIASRWLRAIPEKPSEIGDGDLYMWLIHRLVSLDGDAAEPVLKAVWQSGLAVPERAREEAQELLIDLGIIGPGDRTIEYEI